MAKRQYDTDVESYWNYFLAAFRNIETGEEYEYSCYGERATLTKEEQRELRKMITKAINYTFNGNSYDMLLLTAASLGWSCRELKQLTNAIIEGNMKPWDAEREFKFKVPEVDHVDLIEVAPGRASLKMYNGRLHGKKLQDLPYEPDLRLTEKQAQEVCDYCFVDLDATANLRKALKGEIQLRINLGREHRLDLRSKSDAQVAEAIIGKEIKRITGSLNKPDKNEWPEGKQFYYQTPKFIKFQTPYMKKLLRLVQDTPFMIGKGGYVNLPEVLSSELIQIGNMGYQMGIGGLHSTEKCISHVAGDNYILRDSDVTSYYPSIIIRLGLFPKQLGPAFKKVYKKIVDDRVHAKGMVSECEKRLVGVNDPDRIAEIEAEMKKWKIAADGGKIMVNGSFGKFGSSYSILYSPPLLIQTTVTGQLSLMMLIEALVEEGFEVISANTDGIITKIPVDRQDEYQEILDWWQEQTGFNMEYTDYKGVYSRDVNSYVALTTKGKAKSKGAFSLGTLQVNPEYEICIDAVIAYLNTGKPIMETIRECQKISKFISLRTVNGGAIWPNKWIGPESRGYDRPIIQTSLKDGTYLGKSIRWYYAVGVETNIHYKKATKTGTHNKVPKTDGAVPCMELPDTLPSNIDYARYMRMAYKLLEDVGYEQNPYGKVRAKK